MKEIFTIYYKGQTIPVNAAELLGNIVFTLQIRHKKMSIEINDQGFWQEVEGEQTPEAQELGYLIEKHDD